MSEEKELGEIAKLLPGKIEDLVGDHSKITQVIFNPEERFARVNLESLSLAHHLHRTSFYEV